MRYYSQAGQDEFVHSLIGDSGYFVDVGAHDGIVHSNTYALEQLGWTGLAIEPDAEALRELRRNRCCFVSGFAMSDDHGYVEIRPSGQVVQSRPLSAVLRFMHDPDGLAVIDYLSIDVEGHELAVLAGMDFDRWHVRCITIEHNLYSDGRGRKDAIFGHLTVQGFERVREDVVAEGYGPYEDWYVHR